MKIGPFRLGWCNTWEGSVKVGTLGLFDLTLQWDARRRGSLHLYLIVLGVGPMLTFETLAYVQWRNQRTVERVGRLLREAARGERAPGSSGGQDGVA